MYIFKSYLEIIKITPQQLRDIAHFYYHRRNNIYVSIININAFKLGRLNFYTFKRRKKIYEILFHYIIIIRVCKSKSFGQHFVQIYLCVSEYVY